MELPSTFTSQTVKKHSTRLIVGTMIIALLGLIIVQLHWINNAIELSDAVFAQQVNEALDNVAHKAERLEAIRDGMQIVSSMQSTENQPGGNSTSPQIKSQYQKTLAVNNQENNNISDGQSRISRYKTDCEPNPSSLTNRQNDSAFLITAKPSVSLKNMNESTPSRQRLNSLRQLRRATKERMHNPTPPNPDDEVSGAFASTSNQPSFASVSPPTNPNEIQQLSLNIKTLVDEVSDTPQIENISFSTQSEELTTKQQNEVIISRQPLRRVQPLRRIQTKARVWDSIQSVILGKTLTLNFNEIQQQMNCAVDQLRNQQFVVYRGPNGSSSKSSSTGVGSSGNTQTNQGALITIKDNGTLTISAPPISGRSNKSVSPLNLIVTDEKIERPNERQTERQQTQGTYSVAGGTHTKNQSVNQMVFSSGGTSTFSISSSTSRGTAQGNALTLSFDDRRNQDARSSASALVRHPSPPTPTTPPSASSLPRPTANLTTKYATMPTSSVTGTTIGEHYSMLKQEREEASSAKNFRSMNEKEREEQMVKSQEQGALVCTDRVAMKLRSIQETMSELGEFTTTLEQRINNHILDSMIAAEFSIKKLPLDYEFAVENGQFKTVSFTKNSNPTNQYEIFKDSPYSTVLFPNDILQRNHKLYVMFPNKTSYLAGTNLSVILYSALFVVMIVGCFGWTLNNLNKHKAVSAMKSDFINNMTHELKTPIATIGLAADALRDPEITASKDRVHRFVSVIKDENARLGTQVERVLQAARLERGEIALSKTEFDVHECISSVVESLSLQIGANGGKITTDFRADNSIIVADEMHITNSLLNLLDNAMKYTDSTPQINISTHNEGNSMIIRVKDNGIGISKEHQQKVFDKLYRVPTGNIHNVKGFGLGLSYVKAIADAHNGEVAVESAPKSGSMFEIALPIQSC